MKIVIDNNGVQGKIDTDFRIYGSKKDLLALMAAICEQVDNSFGWGWVYVCDTGVVPDETVFPFDAALSKVPVYPWGVK